MIVDRDGKFDHVLVGEIQIGDTVISIDIEKLHGMLETQVKICEFVQQGKRN